MVYIKLCSQQTYWTELNWPAPSWPSYTTRYWSRASASRSWLAAGLQCVVAPPCPRSTARLQRSPLGRVESFCSWSSHLFRGRPGERRHLRSAGRLSATFTWSWSCSSRTTVQFGSVEFSWYDTIRDATLTFARKPTWVSLIYRTETTTKKCKTEKLKVKTDMLRSNGKSLGNHVVSPEKGCSGKDLPKRKIF